MAVSVSPLDEVARAAVDISVRLSPLSFARCVGIDPDAWQARVLSSRSRRLLLCCSRQAGKSTVVALRASYRAVTAAGSLILCVSPSDRQSGELFDKVSTFLAALPVPPARSEDNKRSLRLANGSRVVSLPASADTVRGYSAPAMVLIDEAAMVPDEMFAAVRPMLVVSTGELLYLSTPYGKRGVFYETWTSDQAWERIRVPASECPRIAQETLAREKHELPGWLYAQEYECEFVQTLDSVFQPEDIRAACFDAEELEFCPTS